ncbi:uncharacterized protein LOC114366484 [Ostrinia furnacalis]|uniref:uncharacterized protein LOC114366484 n=1 Tax=Ostrinia furnacalis TaxID=93504 RepID=UPI0010407272|nr:uncharacterized protein LOC114366484 [Ostrinia furnacalis]
MLLMTSALMLTPTIYYILGYLITKLNFSTPLWLIVYRPWRLLTLVMALPLGLGALCLSQTPAKCQCSLRERSVIFLRIDPNIIKTESIKPFSNDVPSFCHVTIF